MRILLVSHYFLPAHRAGVENYTYRLARALGARRHEVAVFCREDGFFDRPVHAQDEVFDGVAVHRVYFNGRLDFRTCYRNPALDELFRSYLQGFRPDVVHFQHLERLSAGFIDVARELGIPRVATLNDFWFLCPQVQLLRDGRICGGPEGGLACATCPGVLPEALRVEALARARRRWDAVAPLRELRLLASRLAPARLRRRVEKAVLRRSAADYGVDSAATRERHRDLKDAFGRFDLVLAPSRFLLGLHRDLGFDAPATCYSDYGIPSVDGSPRARPPDRSVRFGYFSAIVPHKGIELLLRAFRRLSSPAAELHVRGQGSPAYEEEVRRLAASDPRVSFLPTYDDAGLSAAFAGIDVLILPSLWYENSPIVIHEAALAGVPVIAANVGGMAEYVRPGANGLLFRVGDERDLAGALQRFVDDPALAASLREVPFEVKSIEQDAAGLEAHYERLRRERGPARGPVDP